MKEIERGRRSGRGGRTQQEEFRWSRRWMMEGMERGGVAMVEEE